MVDFARRSVLAGVTTYLSCCLVFTDFTTFGNRSALFSLFTHFLANDKDNFLRLSFKFGKNLEILIPLPPSPNSLLFELWASCFFPLIPPLFGFSYSFMTFFGVAPLSWELRLNSNYPPTHPINQPPK